MNLILLTGPPSAGKTTMVNKVHEQYSKKGVKIEGITTREIKEGSQRTGFKITDLSTGQEGWLARKDLGVGQRIGSYRVVSEDLEKIGVTALKRALSSPTDLIIIDEIGPMEMTSLAFREVIARVLNGNQSTIATVRKGSRYSEVEQVMEKSVWLHLTRDNREEIYDDLVKRIDVLIRPAGG